VAETKGDKGSRFSLTLWQALHNYNVVVLQRLALLGLALLRKPARSVLMAKRGRAHSPSAAKPQGRQPRPGIVHSSLYLPMATHEALREVAFRERIKMHDGRARLSFHTSFENPLTPGTPPRESIEVRTLVFFPPAS
jgi:hypothetical protein